MSTLFPDSAAGATPPPPDSYPTIAGTAEAEVKIQRSRFIGLAGHAPDESAARQFIADVAKRFHDSRHVCYGWRVGVPPRVLENRSDDGEPSGTAGVPILVEIHKRELLQIVVVVVRYFGGIKLGTGGLARAYGYSANLALEGATIRQVWQGRTFQLQIPYTLQKTLRHLLDQFEGKIIHEKYSAEVTWQIWLPHSQWQSFRKTVGEATAGKVVLVEIESE